MLRFCVGRKKDRRQAVRNAAEPFGCGLVRHSSQRFSCLLTIERATMVPLLCYGDITSATGVSEHHLIPALCPGPPTPVLSRRSIHRIESAAAAGRARAAARALPGPATLRRLVRVLARQ